MRRRHPRRNTLAVSRTEAHRPCDVVLIVLLRHATGEVEREDDLVVFEQAQLGLGVPVESERGGAEEAFQRLREQGGMELLQQQARSRNSSAFSGGQSPAGGGGEERWMSGGEVLDGGWWVVVGG